jgi:hypothetical protein
VVTVGYRLRKSFRLPAGTDPAPSPARLAGVCAWAAALGLLGLPIAGRAAVALITRTPAWLGPTMTAIGLLGITLTVAAFMAIHRHDLPWTLLTAASIALTVNAGLLLG